MLKRRSIRTKLIVALTLLSAIVLLLASSGFWGLYRYRQLANAISQRAMEIPYANDMNRLAWTLRESNKRTSELYTHGGMIDSSSLGDPLFDIEDMEEERFENAFLGFDLNLERYENKAVTTHEKTLLVDNARLHRSLGEIRQLFNTLKEMHHKRASMDVTRDSRSRQPVR